MHQVEWLKKAVFYNIYPQSYYDTNGDGIGDLNGIIEKLDYIHFMGFNALWLNPFYESPFRDAGYDVSDYYKVAPRYGTMGDFKRLCVKAHERGIKVCIDLVGGHTSIDHPWFMESAKPEENQYTNRYIWSDDWLNTPTAAFINGYSDRNGCYMTNYFYSQPAINYGCGVVDDPSWQMAMDHPDCRKNKQELIHIMEYWIEAGCDGFRVDMAPSYVKNDPDGSGNRKFWNEIRAMFDEKYPEHVLISEWGNPAEAIPAGYHVDFLTHCFYKAYTRLLRADKNRNVNKDWQGTTFFDKVGKGNFEDFLEDYLKLREITEGKGYIAIPTGNHDLPRYSIGRTQDELKVICAFVLTMPGVPFVYYGDEIGIRYQADLISKEGGYNRTGSRTPMQWKKGKNLGFSEGKEENLYLPVERSEDAPTVEEQLADEESLLHMVRKLVTLRKTSDALGSDGAVEFLNRENHGYPLVYTRTDETETYLICMNPGAQSQTVDLEKVGGKDKQYQEMLQNREVMIEQGILTLPGVSFWIGKEL
mgnify:CR=1 FL=1